MFRYLGFAWDPNMTQRQEIAQLLTAQLRSRAAEWNEVLTTDGLMVFCADIVPPSLECYALAHNQGVVLGTLFERERDLRDDEPAARAAITPFLSTEIVATRGRALVERFWGNYVAFLASIGGSPKVIFKDPTGSLPCFHTYIQGVHIIFSCIADCLDLGLAFAVDEEFLREHMTDLGMFKRRSALRGVSQVYRGEALLIACRDAETGGTIARKFYWTPARFAEVEQRIEDPASAAVAIRATVRSCVRAWAQRHGSVLLRLSGGLDSSILAGCLGRPQPATRLFSYMYTSPVGRSDERPWAAMAARHSGIRHVECSLDPTRSRLEGISELQPWVEPIWGLQYLERSPLERGLARQLDASAVFSGDGGDSGFCSDSVAYFVQDFLRDRGVSLRALWIAAQVARITEQTAWRILFSALRKNMWGRDDADELSWKMEACHLVSEELRASIAERQAEHHPWLSAEKDVPISYDLRLGTLISTPDYYDLSSKPGDAVPEVVTPLYSQPVIEVLLRVPSYVHFQNGRDRGLARRAFEEEVPTAILRRQWKDRGPGFVDHLILANLKFLREALLDGELVRRGLLNRRALEDALSLSQTHTQSRAVEILRHLDTEMWARHWLGKAQLQVAA